MRKNSGSNLHASGWEKLPLLVGAALSGFLVSTSGVAIWSLFLFGIKPPWSILPMLAALFFFCKFFSGRCQSDKKHETRQRYFRAVKLSPEIWKWGLTTAVFFIVVIQSSFVVTFRIFEFPAKQFTADYKILDKMPLFTAWAILSMSAIVAGICEETGYRGYMQVPLEGKYGPRQAIIISSILFTLIHLSKSWAYPILPHIFFASVMLGILAYRSGSLIPGIFGHSILDIFNYSFWWSGITGGFKKLTIFKTGIDIHFVVWTSVFLLSLFIFFKVVGNLKNVN